MDKFVQKLKSTTSYKLLREFATLHKKFGGQHLWASGYFVTTTGTVTDKVIMECIENQDVGVPVMIFKLVGKMVKERYFSSDRFSLKKGFQPLIQATSFRSVVN